MTWYDLCFFKITLTAVWRMGCGELWQRQWKLAAAVLGGPGEGVRVQDVFWNWGQVKDWLLGSGEVK